MKYYLIYSLGSIFLLILLLLFIYLSFLIFQKYKNEKNNKILTDLEETLKNIENDILSTLRRFNSISKSQTRYLEKHKKIKNLYKILINYLEEFENLKEINQKKISFINIFEIQKNQRTLFIFKTKIDNFVEEYKSLTKIINDSWNLIETGSNESFEILNYINKYLEINKDILNISYSFVKEKLNNLYELTKTIEEQKQTNKITNVANSIEENKKRIILFANKINNLVKIEISIKKFLPLLIKESNLNIEEIELLNNEYLMIKNSNWILEPLNIIIKKLGYIFNLIFIFQNNKYWNFKINDLITKSTNILKIVNKNHEKFLSFKNLLEEENFYKLNLYFKTSMKKLKKFIF
ncbi:hypothetical protein [Mycoplasma sp. 1018B]|uniref:hypothetical protein n=1 Tax=Mycoplasma sp. 1018B TaxID=2967302 RepID=UPI00211C93C8|nr:hypothetical protein [Mycoplasma sp. 1018B]UUM19155.1 hypothetical protein NPA14_02370 [Mycoplasma sp. 1018B]